MWSPPAINPHLHRWMMFVDGENFAIEGAKHLQSQGLSLREGAFYKKDVVLWIPQVSGISTDAYTGLRGLQSRGTRSYYYTSMEGSDAQLLETRKQLRALDFSPHVFKRIKNRAKSKGLDLTVAKDLLANAYMNNYDSALLVAGDGDYVPLVQEIQRLGKRVVLLFFPCPALNSDLQIEVDEFYDLTNAFANYWARIS